MHRAVSFVVKDPSGAAVTSVCPGSKYSVVVGARQGCLALT